jgi:hypothetical protein
MNTVGSQTNVGAMLTLVTWHRNHAKRDNVASSCLRPKKGVQIDSCTLKIHTFILPSYQSALDTMCPRAQSNYIQTTLPGYMP